MLSLTLTSDLLWLDNKLLVGCKKGEMTELTGERDPDPRKAAHANHSIFIDLSSPRGGAGTLAASGWSVYVARLFVLMISYQTCTFEFTFYAACTRVSPTKLDVAVKRGAGRGAELGPIISFISWIRGW